MSHGHEGQNFVVVLALLCPADNDEEDNVSATGCIIKHAVRGHGFTPMSGEEMRAHMEAGGGIGTVLAAVDLIESGPVTRDDIYGLMGEDDLARWLKEDE